MCSATRLLIIDDDKELCDLLQQFLSSAGFDVEAVHDGAVGARRALSGEHAAAVLDVMLPGSDGFTVLRQIRERSRLPVIMLTARGEEADRISGLETGADDYLPKPFNPRELVARVNAVLRRRQPAGPPGAPASDTEIHRFGAFEFNLATRSLAREGKPVALTTGEFSVLKVLVQHPRQPLSRDKLMELARGREYEVFDRSIDVQISRLRKIVEQDPSHPKHIQTVWGFGYVFVPEADGAK